MLSNILLLIFSFSFAQDYVPGEVIVKFKASTSKTSMSAFKARVSAKGRMKVKGAWSSLKMQHYKTNNGQTVQEAMRDLANDPSVEYVEPNYILRKSEQQNVGVAGELLSELEFEALASANQDNAFSQTTAPIDAKLAWGNVSATSERPIVAIIDTGIDYTHTALSRWCALWQNTAEKNGVAGVDDDGNGYIDDIYGYDFANGDGSPYDDDGHGTHVAGIVLGATQDILASPEVAPSGGNCAAGYESRIRLMAVKFLDGDGNGTTSDAIKAIYYAINNGASVLNNSWGGGSYSKSLHDAITYAYNQSVAFVAAAGNSASDNDVYAMYPANYDVPNVISVASTQSNDVISYFSNYGDTSVHIASPGSSIYSTYPGNFYTYMSGTSMATPFVSGVAALLYREEPSITSYQVRELIISSGDSLSGLQAYVSSSKRLNVNNAVLAVQGSSIDSSQPSYTADYSSYERAPASTESSAGCGMVKKLDTTTGGNGRGLIGLFGLLLLPLIMLYAIRPRTGINRRRFERVNTKSDLKVMVDGKEVHACMESISTGGLGLDMKQELQKGQRLTFKIKHPNGSDELEVNGKIVWSNGSDHHGIQFTDCNDKLKAVLQNMVNEFKTLSLQKS